MDKIVKGDVTYYKLFSSCPHCRKNGVITPSTEWIHKQCGGLIYIGDNASLLCEKCGWTIPIRQARCNCPNHEDCSIANIELEKRDFGIFDDGIGLIYEYSEIAGLPWLTHLIKNLKSL